MDRKSDRETLRKQALVALDEARAHLGAGVGRAREDFNPRALMLKSAAKHRALIAVATVVAGFISARLVLPRRARIDKNLKPATKRTLSGLMMGGLWAMARAPLTEYVKDHLQALVMNRLNSTRTPKKPDFPK